MRKEIFEAEEFYHIYNRGVDKRIIFTKEKEYTRFVNSAYILNNYVEIPFRFNVYSLEPKDLLTPTDPYIEVLAACLMPNHYHLVIREKRRGGISMFLQKLNSSYTHFFNLSHERTGRLFEGPFKARHIDKDEYGHYISYYVHLNPIKLCRSKIGTEEAFEELIRYPWSSLPIFMGGDGPLAGLVSTWFRDEILDMDAREYRESLRELYFEKCADLRSAQKIDAMDPLNIMWNTHV